MEERINKSHEILFVNPPAFIEGTLNTQPIPLGLIFMNRYLKERGFLSEIVNLSECGNWLSVLDHFDKSKPPHIIGITSFTRQRFSTLQLASKLKALFPESIICLGGPHASFLDEAILRHNSSIDYIVRGEGEVTFYELVKHYYNNSLVSMRNSIAGISFLDTKNHFIRTEDREMISNLSILPLPLQTEEELGTVLLSDSLRFHFPDSADAQFTMAPVITSRGCNGHCSFCCNRAYWGNNRCSSAMYAFKQFDYYYKMGIHCFDIYDDNFTSNPEMVLQLCDLIIESGMDIHWWCSSRVDCINSELLKKMKTAGCFMISFGVESGSQKVLDSIGKGVMIENIISACNYAKHADLSFRMTISIGHLGETSDTIDETIQLINMLRPAQIALFLLKVYPGTPIAELMKKRNLLSDEYWFDESGENVPLFTCEHSPDQLLEYRNRIINSIQAQIINRYEDELSSVELDLYWG